MIVINVVILVDLVKRTLNVWLMQLSDDTMSCYHPTQVKVSFEKELLHVIVTFMSLFKNSTVTGDLTSTILQIFDCHGDCNQYNNCDWWI